MMEVQHTEKTEAASGKGEHHERSPHDVLRSETMDTDRIDVDVNMQHWENNVVNVKTPVPVEILDEEYKAFVDGLNDADEVKDAEEVKVMNEADKEDEDKDFNEEADEYECQEWINQYSRYVPPIPKYLIIKNTGRRRFSDENVMRRTAWLGKFLHIRDRNKLPEMRTIEIAKEGNKDEREKVIAIVSETQEQSRRLLGTQKIGPCRVRVISDERKNTVSGVLVDFDKYFKNMSNEDMEIMLASEGVSKVKKLGNESSMTYKIIFNMLRRPERVKVFGDRRSFPIRAYIPPPLRCYRCQKYDHAKTSCRLPPEQSVCQRCGGNHQSKVYRDKILIHECSQPLKCYHCKEAHETGFYKCASQISQVDVNKLMVNENISRFEAKSRVFSQFARSDAKVITTAIRLEESKKELEESRKREAEGKDEIAAMNKKLEAFMTEIRSTVSSSPADNQEGNIEVMVKQAVESATKKIQEESNQKFEKFQKQLQEKTNINKKNTATIASLTAKNRSLEDDAKKLRDQLAKANAANLELKKKQAVPKTVVPRTVVPKQIDPNKTGVKIQSNKPETITNKPGVKILNNKPETSTGESKRKQDQIEERLSKVATGEDRKPMSSTQPTKDPRSTSKERSNSFHNSQPVTKPPLTPHIKKCVCSVMLPLCNGIVKESRLNLTQETPFSLSRTVVPRS